MLNTSLPNFKLKANILLIEENEQDSNLFGNILINRGFNLTIIKSGEKAIQYTQHYQTCIIIIGSIRDMGITELCSRLRAQVQNIMPPIICLSSNMQADHIVECFKAGVSDYINKQCKPEELLARLNGQIDSIYIRKKNEAQLQNLISMQMDLARQSQEVMMLNEELEEKSAILQEVNAQQNALFSIISHDLRGPLAGINSLINTLFTYYDNLDNDDRKHKIDILAKESKLASKYMDNLLLWAQTQLGEHEPFLQDACLATIIQNALLPLQPKAQAKEININNNIPQDINVYCDMVMISNVMRNLIANAIKYTARGGSVTISANLQHNMVDIRIIDSGIGMPEVNIKKLFRMDAKIITNGTENEKGSGLGLMICKEILSKHQQKLKCKSAINEGSTFSFQLPINEPEIN